MRARSVTNHIGESTRMWAGQRPNPKHLEGPRASTCSRQAEPGNLARTGARSAVTHSILRSSNPLLMLQSQELARTFIEK